MRTNAGTDLVAACIAGTSAQPAAANYVAHSASTAARNATDTALAGEINAAGGGLNRKQATYAHTNGTNTFTLTVTHTANASDTLPVTIGSSGVLNAASVGTLAWEWLITAAPMAFVGDSTTTSFTGTIS